MPKITVRGTGIFIDGESFSKQQIRPPNKTGRSVWVYFEVLGGKYDGSIIRVHSATEKGEVVELRVR